MLYGRDAERAEIGRLLEAARASSSGALVLRGEPGIGKTALLEDARERAADMHVLSARGVESETELPFAGLHQLVWPSLHLLDQLPGPQAGALQGALGLTERAGDDRFLISAACLTLLSELAERRPVLCLVDDAQWLDTPSLDALLFVARRLDAEGIVMLFAVRDADPRRLEARDLREVELRALDSEASEALLSRSVDGEIAPSIRDFLLEQAGGNALALVELPAALTSAQLTGREAPPETLPLTRDVERLFLERVRRLPEPTQRLLLIAAADDTGQLATVMRGGEALGIDPDALAAAERADVVTVRGSSIEMRHPLIRSAVYQGASSDQCRAVHLSLADALSDEKDADQRAWHRAAAALGPDAAVADALESTAERARLRSGHAAAATALERAAELSADTGSRARRLVMAANAAWHAGQPERARTLLDRAVPVVSDPSRQAELNHLRGVIEWRCGALPDASPMLIEGAAEIASSDPRKALEMLFDAGMAAADAGDYGRVAEIGRRTAMLPAAEDEEQAFLADMLVGVGLLSEGKSSLGAPLILEAIGRARELEDPRLLAWAAVWAPRVGESALEAPILRRAATLARASAAVDTLTFVLEGVAVQGFLAGQYTVVSEATEGLELAREAGLPNAASHHRASLAWLSAVKGREDDCRTYASEVIDATKESGHALANSIAEWGVALLDLSLGRPDAAATRLLSLSTARPGVAHPLFVAMSAPDLVEASVRCGRDETARSAFTVLERFVPADAPSWAMALAARSRALLSIGEQVEAEFTEALRLHAESNRPFDRARTELLFGEHLRRSRRRIGSREHLRAALEGFEALGAAIWAERARSELRASGESARKRDASTVDQLTPQELQVARFVADGLSNKEVAAQLFLSPRTIDAHLRNVFAKLGLTSRTQLAGVLLGSGPEAIEVAASA